MRKFVITAGFLIFLFSPWVSGRDKADEINPEIQRALELSDIRHSKMPPFHLSATVAVTVKGKAPLKGKYVLLKNSDGDWREELTLPGFSRLRVGDEHNYWQVRTAEYNPLPIQNIDELLDFPGQLNIEKKRKFTKPSKTKKDGAELFCQHAKEDPIHEETVCFDPSGGELIFRDNGLSNFQSAGRVSSEQFSDFQGIGAKRFPTSLRGFNEKNFSWTFMSTSSKKRRTWIQTCLLPPQGRCVGSFARSS